MQPPEPEKKPKINRLTIDLVIFTALFLGLLVGVQSLQGSASHPKYDPLAIVLGPLRFIQSLHK